MVEINYDGKTGEYTIFHDGKIWELEKLKKHIWYHGHEWESVSVAVSKEAFGMGCEIAKGIEDIFNEKGLPKDRRQGL